MNDKHARIDQKSSREFVSVNAGSETRLTICLYFIAALELVNARFGLGKFLVAMLFICYFKVSCQ